MKTALDKDGSLVEAKAGVLKQEYVLTVAESRPCVNALAVPDPMT